MQKFSNGNLLRGPRLKEETSDHEVLGREPAQGGAAQLRKRAGRGEDN